MVDSGVKVHKEVTDIMVRFSKLEGRERNPTYDYLVLNIDKIGNDKHQMVHLLKAEPYGASAEKYADKDTSGVPYSYYALKEVLSESKKPLFGVIYLSKPSSDGIKSEKLTCIAWTHPEAKVADKMIFSSTKDTVKKALQPEKMVQANDHDELLYSEVLAIFN